ncbi:uncharacterized protein LOC110906847 [Helianthus annuus]|uniref:uncharacterized protein LOC110906847 n=1 Tax=Helianthus annuus TaxID=4232 RepID=UPI001652EDE0|nr:uncharacterized protein LOC110906847 [Helianthus annuus]
MARSPSRQRIVAIGAFYVSYVTIRWWMLCTYHLRRSIESMSLRTKYLMSYHNRRENLVRMVYQSDVTSVVNIRMNIHAFTTLCDMLETRGGLKDSKNMLVDEQVAMFLHTLAHNAKNRILVNRFNRSGETVSRYFKLVLNAICRLHKELYKSPVPVPDNETDERWKWFKGCLGALDGTYIKVKVPAIDRKPYRTRKGQICTNVLGVCTRDLLFTYVLAGWEGSAADSRVLRDAISRPNGLKITPGTYYLCDAGYTNGEGFLTPYRGQRYHLNDWSRPPTNAKEFFKAVDLGEEDVVQETQKSSPVDIEDFDFFDEAVPNVDRSEGQTGSVTSKRKRGRRMDADEIYRESCKDIKEVLLRFGEMVGEQLSKEGMEAREIYEKVSDELKGLPGITTKKRLKAAHLIGKDVDLGRSFLALTIEEKIEMVELYTDGSMG